MSKQKKKSRKKPAKSPYLQMAKNSKKTAVRMSSKNMQKYAKKPVKKPQAQPVFSFSDLASELKSQGFFNFKKFTKATLLTTVALIECVMLLVLGTFSWIESSSSLTIKGINNMYVAGERKSDYIQLGAYDSNSIVDLHDYFMYTSRFMLARASSPNGKDFYLPTKIQGSVGNTYRLGDTTDYNINYYCIDFNVVNNVGVDYNYYFNSSDILTFEDAAELTAAEQTTVKNALRVSVQKGTDNPKIYSSQGGSQRAITNTSGAQSSSVSTTSFSYSTYDPVTASNNTDAKAVFIVGKNAQTPVTVRIWLEERALGTGNVQINEMCKKLSKASMNIDLGLRMADTGAKILTFEDCTVDSFNESNFGKNFTLSQGESYKMYFYYLPKSGSQKYFAMTSSIENGHTVWRTVDALTKSEIDNMSEDSCYFYYGKANGYNKLACWYLDKTNTPMTPTNNSYIYKALGVVSTDTYNSATTKVGYGVWGNINLSRVYFDDKNTANTTNAFNNGGYRFINENGQGSLYVTPYYQSSGSNNYVQSLTGDLSPYIPAINMYYDDEYDLWYADVPSTWLVGGASEKIYFNFTGTKKYRNSDVDVHYEANKFTSVQGDYTYTGLGYATSSSITLNTLKSAENNTVTGNGTWGQVEPINLSCELIDTTSNGAWRYRLTVAGNSYFMAPSRDNLFLTTYVPVDTQNQPVTFNRYTTSAMSTVGATFTAGARDKMDSTELLHPSNTYYITGTNTGQWHIVVLSDETVDNLVNQIMSDTSISTRKLQYSVDGINYTDMTKLDNYRWYTDDFNARVDNVYIRWTTYSAAEHFDYTVDLGSGIYLSITE